VGIVVGVRSTYWIVVMSLSRSFGAYFESADIVKGVFGLVKTLVFTK
jgi:hypothetical protein